MSAASGPSPTPSTTPTLAVRGLTIHRGREPVVAGLDLAVRAGEVRALRGPNGAGKSSVLAAVCGAIPFTGEIALALGRPGAVGLMPQATEPDPTLPLTVDDLLALALTRRPRFFGTGRRVRTALDALRARVGLGDLGGREVASLSGGQRQRAYLARALAGDPDLLLLDEPARGVDDAGRAALAAVLAEARGPRARAVLVVTHQAGGWAAGVDSETRIGAAAS